MLGSYTKASQTMFPMLMVPMYPWHYQSIPAVMRRGRAWLFDSLNGAAALIYSRNLGGSIFAARQPESHRVEDSCRIQGFRL